MTSQADKLAALLRSDEMIVAPGAYDCITARMVDQAGYAACYMTGAGVAATLGFPDYGIVTMTEMADTAGRMTNVLNIPLIADADTGYGTELNVVRTVQEHERAGTAGIHIEDQVSPKRCGHLDGKELITRDEYVAKMKTPADRRYLEVHEGHLIYLKPGEEKYLDDPIVRASTLTGTAEEIIARLKAMEAVGLRQVAIQVVYPQGREMIEEFSREVIAKY